MQPHSCFPSQTLPLACSWGDREQGGSRNMGSTSRADEGDGGTRSGQVQAPHLWCGATPVGSQEALPCKVRLLWA